MGKFQLDYKGQAQVQRFHEKQSRESIDKKARVKDLQAKFLAKKKQT